MPNGLVGMSRVVANHLEKLASTLELQTLGRKGGHKFALTYLLFTFDLKRTGSDRVDREKLHPLE